MLQDQHAKQIAQMEATNKTNMDAMIEQMNALVAARDARHAHQPDKVNTPPGSNTVDPFTIPTDLEEVIVVMKLSTAHCMLNLLGGPVGFSVGSVGSVARANQ